MKNASRTGRGGGGGGILSFPRAQVCKVTCVHCCSVSNCAVTMLCMSIKRGSEKPSHFESSPAILYSTGTNQYFSQLSLSLGLQSLYIQEISFVKVLQ